MGEAKYISDLFVLSMTINSSTHKNIIAKNVFIYMFLRFVSFLEALTGISGLIPVTVKDKRVVQLGTVKLFLAHILQMLPHSPQVSRKLHSHTKILTFYFQKNYRIIYIFVPEAYVLHFY